MPSASRTWRSSRCRPRARKILVVKSSCWRQSAMMGRPKKPCAHWFISPATSSATSQEDGVPGDRQLEVALVVERHGIDLARARPRRRTSSRRHPTAARRRRCGGRSRCCAFGRAAGPVPWIHWRFEIGRDLAPVEVAVAGVLNPDARARDERLGIEEGDALPAALPRQSPRDAPCHQLAPVAVERRQDLQRLKRRRGVDLGVRLKHAVAVIESSSHPASRTPKLMPPRDLDKNGYLAFSIIIRLFRCLLFPVDTAELSIVLPCWAVNLCPSSAKSPFKYSFGCARLQ